MAIYWNNACRMTLGFMYRFHCIMSTFARLMKKYKFEDNLFSIDLKEYGSSIRVVALLVWILDEDPQRGSSIFFPHR
jgi:hypothetical protein